MRNSNFWHRVPAPAARAAGLDGISAHDLRHTAASLAIAAGANIKVVRQMLDHASAAMTLDVYAGLFGDDLDAVADSLDAAARGLVRAFADIARRGAGRVDLLEVSKAGLTRVDSVWGGGA